MYIYRPINTCMCIYKHTNRCTQKRWYQWYLWNIKWSPWIFTKTKFKDISIYYFTAVAYLKKKKKAEIKGSLSSHRVNGTLSNIRGNCSSWIYSENSWKYLQSSANPALILKQSTLLSLPIPLWNLCHLDSPVHYPFMPTDPQEGSFRKKVT